MELQRLAMTLFDYLGKALMLEKEEMGELFEDGMQSVRMTYYPPCPQPELVVGLTPHSDATGITILHQVNGVEGLQMKKDGVWIPVSFRPDSFIVNIGDILEVSDRSSLDFHLYISKFCMKEKSKKLKTCILNRPVVRFSGNFSSRVQTNS